MLPKSNGNGEYIVNRKTGIALGLVILIISGAVWFVTSVSAQNSKIDVLNSEVENLEQSSDYKFTSINKRLERIEDKIDQLLRV